MKWGGWGGVGGWGVGGVWVDDIRIQYCFDTRKCFGIFLEGVGGICIVIVCGVSDMVYVFLCVEKCRGISCARVDRLQVSTASVHIQQTRNQVSVLMCLSLSICWGW